MRWLSERMVGYNYVTGIKSNGTLWTWGFKIGTFNEDTALPIQIGVDTNWQSLTSGDSHSFVFKSDGSLWGWGNNNWGKLGNGTMVDERSPIRIGDEAPTGLATQSFCGTATIASLQVNGTAIKWYATASGGTPLATSTPLTHNTHYYATQTIASCESVDRLDVLVLINSNSTPAPTGESAQTFCLTTTVAYLSASGTNIKWYDQPTGGTLLPNHTPLNSGSIYYASQTINYCESQQRLAVTFTREVTQPHEPILGPRQVCPDISLGGVMANTNWYATASGGTKLSMSTPIVEGTIYYASRLGECGESIERSPRTFVIRTASPPLSATNETWTSIAGGMGESMAVRSDGTLWEWGNEFINPTLPTGRYTPAQFGTINTWQTIQFGGGLFFSINSADEIYTWGTNNFPAGKIGTQTDWVSIIGYGLSGGNHWAALKKDNTLWTWGDNVSGELGDGTQIRKISPTKVGTDSDWKTVAAGYHFTIAIKTDGTLWAWGNNDYGQLGDGTNVPKKVPTRIGTDSDWASISTNYYSSMAMKQDGTLWAWGDTEFGKLGIGISSGPQHVPMKIGADQWRAFSLGSNHTLAIRADGTLWAWGYGGSGALGLSRFTTPNSNIPIQVSTETHWRTVSSGSNHSMAITSDGVLWMWGSNAAGELGAGRIFSFNGQPTPHASKQFLCNDPNVTLADLPIHGENIRWYRWLNGHFQSTASSTSTEGSEGLHFYATQTINGLESCHKLDVVIDLGAPLPPTGEALQSFCKEAIIKDLKPSNQYVIWHNSPTGNSQLSESEPLHNGQAYYASVNYNGCKSETRLKVQAQLFQPATPSVPSQQVYCFGSDSKLENLLPFGSQNVWFSDVSGGSPLPLTTPLTNQSTYYVAEVFNGCESSRIPVTVEEFDAPAPFGSIVQIFNGDVTIADLEVYGDHVKWYASQIDATERINALPESSPLIPEAYYYGTQTIRGCESSQFLSVKVSLITSIHPEADALNLYPNPTTDRLKVLFSERIQQIVIFNAIGQPVESQEIMDTEAELDIAALPVGLYSVKVYVNGKVIVKKVMKK